MDISVDIDIDRDINMVRDRERDIDTDRGMDINMDRDMTNVGMYVDINAVLRSRSYLFLLRLRPSKSFRSCSDFSFVGTCLHSFFIKRLIFHYF
jgi:hypothetical protein